MGRFFAIVVYNIIYIYLKIVHWRLYKLNVKKTLSIILSCLIIINVSVSIKADVFLNRWGEKIPSYLKMNSVSVHDNSDNIEVSLGFQSFKPENTELSIFVDNSSGTGVTTSPQNLYNMPQNFYWQYAVTIAKNNNKIYSNENTSKDNYGKELNYKLDVTYNNNLRRVVVKIPKAAVNAPKNISKWKFFIQTWSDMNGIEVAQDKTDIVTTEPFNYEDDNMKMVILYSGMAPNGRKYTEYTDSYLKNPGETNEFVVVVPTDRESNDDAVKDMAKLITRIANNNTDSKVWISTPEIGYLKNSDGFYSYYEKIKTYLEDVKEAIGNSIWSQNVKGIYMNSEAIYEGFPDGNMFNNTQIKLMNNLSSYIHSSLCKKFLWIPYYGYGTNSYKFTLSLAFVANRSNIFDYVIIQPHYYFDSSCVKNLDAVYYSVKNQYVSLPNGLPVAERTPAATAKIGFEMELDGNYLLSDSESLKKYNDYVQKFKELRGTCPICFYGGGEAYIEDINEVIQRFYQI